MMKSFEKEIEDMAGKALRTILIGYTELEENMDINEKDKRGWPQVENKDFILIGIFGIQDPVREEVPGAVLKCQRAGIKVRMVTGDNVITARAIADLCHIMRGKTPEENLKRVMIGPDFRALCGGIVCKKCRTKECPCPRSKRQAKKDEQIRIDVVKNFDEFEKIIDNLDVLARSSPEDKYLLVSGLQQKNQIVAVTGDGTNDAPALKKADIGFAMFIAGTEVAKDACDILLMDDNFNSIVNACKWGRNIYDNIRRFLQFQLTVNIVAVTVALVGSFTIKESPLSAVQMLWVNLIMDTLASLALATMPPNEKLLEREPCKKEDYIISKVIFQNRQCGNIFQARVAINALFYFSFFLQENTEFRNTIMMKGHISIAINQVEELDLEEPSTLTELMIMIIGMINQKLQVDN